MKNSHAVPLRQYHPCFPVNGWTFTSDLPGAAGLKKYAVWHYLGFCNFKCSKNCDTESNDVFITQTARNSQTNPPLSAASLPPASINLPPPPLSKKALKKAEKTAAAAAERKAAAKASTMVAARQSVAPQRMPLPTPPTLRPPALVPRTARPPTPAAATATPNPLLAAASGVSLGSPDQQLRWSLRIQSRRDTEQELATAPRNVKKLRRTPK
jgi:hypothetical protein